MAGDGDEERSAAAASGGSPPLVTVFPFAAPQGLR